MIHLFVWPIVVIALVQRNDIFKRIGIAIGIIASIAAVAVGVNTWPLQLIAISFYWIGTWLIALFIRWVIKKHNSSKQ